MPRRPREVIPRERHHLTPYDIRISNSLTDFAFGLSERDLRRAGFGLDAESAARLGVNTRVMGGDVWELYQVTHINGYTRCQLCGHYPIRRLFWIRCRFAHDEVRVIGSECARNFVQADLVQAYLRRLVREQGRARIREARSSRVPQAEREARAAQLRSMFQAAGVAQPTSGTIQTELGNLEVTSVTFHPPDAAPHVNLPAPNTTTVSSASYNPAGRDDAPEVANGDFTFEDSNSTYRFQIWTVQNGSLANQRIVRRWSSSEHRWQGFGSVTVDGSLYVWRSCRQDELDGRRYINLARSLIREIARHSNLRHGRVYADGIVWDMAVQMRCRHCNTGANGPLCRSCDPIRGDAAPVANNHRASYRRSNIIMSEIIPTEVR